MLKFLLFIICNLISFFRSVTFMDYVDIAELMKLFFSDTSNLLLVLHCVINGFDP